MSYNYLQTSREKFNNDIPFNICRYSRTHYNFDGTNYMSSIVRNTPVTFAQGLHYIMLAMADDDAFRNVEVQLSSRPNPTGYCWLGFRNIDKIINSMTMQGYDVKQNHHNSADMFNFAIARSHDFIMNDAKEHFMSKHEDIMECMY